MNLPNHHKIKNNATNKKRSTSVFFSALREVTTNFDGGLPISIRHIASESLANKAGELKANCKSSCFFYLLATLASQTQARFFSEMKVCIWRTGDRRLCLGVFFGGLASSKCKMAIPSSMDFFGKLPEFATISQRVFPHLWMDHLRTHTSPSSQVIDASLCWEI